MGAPDRNHGSFSGWRKAGILNTVLIWVLSLALVGLLFTSVWYLGSGWPSFVGTSLLFEGHCETASRVNVILHIFVNAISTLVLASSNFFMQVLSAPTRGDVDGAHAHARYLDVGVQSVRNLGYVGRWKTMFWLLLSISSVPLHLFFNSCVTESKASTDFVFVVAAGSFLHDGNFTAPGVATLEMPSPSDFPGITYDQITLFNEMLAMVRESIRTTGWDNVTIEECMSLYDDPSSPLITRRHVVMVVSDEGETETAGWVPTDIRLENNNYTSYEGYNESLSAVWLLQEFDRTETDVGVRENRRLDTSYYTKAEFEEWDHKNWVSSVVALDLKTGLITPDPSLFKSDTKKLQAHYCLSEPFVVPCQLHVHNLTLLIVTAFCLVKSIACLTVVRRLRLHHPLLTPGDAIESFIANPDPATNDMCWISRHPKLVLGPMGSRRWLSGCRPWKRSPRRTGSSVPMPIWIVSYLLFYSIIGFVGFLAYAAYVEQPLQASVFGPSSANVGTVGIGEEMQSNPLGGAVLANTPQVALSIAYLAYNGLFTRMLAEREWSSLSVKFQSLRVSRPKGRQKSSYRLQLPFRWSIPLMFISGLLHWLVSNCIYINLYVSYPALPPYSGNEEENGVGYSTKAIFITVIVSFCLSLVPIILARFKLPGNMVLVANNSAIISAACHAIPTESAGAETSDVESMHQMLLYEHHRYSKASSVMSWKSPDEQLLYEMSTQKLKWGVVYRGRGTPAAPGHIAFGTLDQNVEAPIEGSYYAGKMHGSVTQHDGEM